MGIIFNPTLEQTRGLLRPQSNRQFGSLTDEVIEAMVFVVAYHFEAEKLILSGRVEDAQVMSLDLPDMWKNLATDMVLIRKKNAIVPEFN